MKRSIFCAIAVCGLILLSESALGQTTAFKYQGSLTDGGNTANGTFQMQFKLFDAVSGGAQVGSTVTNTSVAVANGVFSLNLDFGAPALSGANRWLEIAVRRNSGESYVTLSPREQLNSSPFAVRTLSAVTADNATQLGGVPASQFVQTNDPRLSDPRTPLPGSASYIQNTQTPQTGSNFNISGTGTVGSLISNGAINLGGIAAPSTAPAGQTRLYFDTATNKLRVSENGEPFVNLVGASGVSGSGVVNRIPLWSAGTTLGDSALSQAGSFIGIGNPSPSFGLDIRGTGFGSVQRITDNTSGNSLVLQAGAGGNMKVTGYNYNTNTAVPLFFGVDGANTILNPNLGNVGVGTASPSTKLSVFSTFYGLSHTDGTVSLSTFLNSTGGWFGTRSNHPLHFYTNDANPQMTLSTSGQVGIGTAPDPNFRLDAGGSIRTQSATAANFVAQTTGGTNTWARLYMRSPSQSWFIGTSQNFNGNQLYITDETAGQTRMVIATNGNVGIGTTNPATRLFVQGNVGQSETSFGMPKAIAVVNGDGTMVRCYNGLTGSSSGTCGFSTSRVSSGWFSFNPGFNVSNKIVLVSVQHNASLNVPPVAASYLQSATAVTVYVYESNSVNPNGFPFLTDRPFTIVIY